MVAIILDGYEELRKKYPKAVREYRRFMPTLLTAKLNFLKWMKRYGYWSSPVYSLIGKEHIVFKTRGDSIDGNWRRFVLAIEQEMARYEADTSSAVNNYAS